MEMMNSGEAAAYLRLSERKLYELVATGAIPCSKVTGRWVFPRDALDRWVLSGLQRPPGFTPAEPPPIVGGSQDDLLTWCLRQSGSGLALLTEGTQRGIERLREREVIAAAIHYHSGDDDPNVAAMTAMRDFSDALLVGFARREQGLVLPSGNPRSVTDFDHVVAEGLSIAIRQPGAGARMLLDQLLTSRGLAVEMIRRGPSVCLTGPEVAAAVREGNADCGIATRAVASGAGLHFVPIAWEGFDLAMRQRSFFTPAVQALVAFLRQPAVRAQADVLGGYDLSPAGTIRYVS